MKTRALTPFLVLLTVTCIAVPAARADERQRKAATALAEQAAKAFQTADLDKAAKFYLEAARNDPDEPSYIYGAARAEQSAGLLDRAEKHYKQFIAAPNADVSRVAKAKANLNEIQHSRAEVLCQEADEAAKRRDWVLAASSWLEAYHLAADRPQVLVKAAVAEREAGDMPSAIKHLELFLRVTLPDAAERIKAESLLNQLRPGGSTAPTATAAKAPPSAPAQSAPGQSAPAQAASAKPESGAAAPPGPPPPPAATTSAPTGVAAPVAPASSGGSGRIGLWTCVAGATVAAAGIGVFAWGLGEAADLQKQLGDSDGAVHTALSREEASARAKTITGHQAIGGGLAGLGAVATGVGLWLWLSDSPAAAAAVVPTGNGFACVARF